MKVKLGYMAIGLFMVAILCFSLPQPANAIIVGEWFFNEGSGTTAADSSGNGNTGTLVNGPTWTTDSPFGYSPYALDFDGFNDYVNIPDSTSLDITGAITVEAWMKPFTVSPSSNWRAAVCKLHTSGADKGGYGFFTTEDQTEVYFFTEAGGGACFTGANLALDAWNYVVGTYDAAGNIAIYVDGQYKDGGNLPGYAPHQTDRPLYIGGNPDGDGFAQSEFEGRIDGVKIYNEALNADTIMQNYTPTIPEPTTMFLLGGGLLGMVAFGRRRKKS